MHRQVYWVICQLPLQYTLLYAMVPDSAGNEQLLHDCTHDYNTLHADS